MADKNLTEHEEFKSAIVKFRARLGDNRHTDEQLRNAWKWVTLLYLRLEDAEPMAELFRRELQEYCQRMRLLGHEV